MSAQTATQRLATILVGEPIEAWIDKQREAGVSWRGIALMLRDRTGGQVDITGEAIRQWVTGKEGAA